MSGPARLLVRERGAAVDDVFTGASPGRAGLRPIRSLYRQGRAVSARSGARTECGVLLIHRVNNYLGHVAGWELADRGYLVLAMNRGSTTTKHR